ncbi:hypothetical protein EB796_004802 [Bugula neritina]|uniref:Uncharacterized protein n=1 Tax=Bugula neritina TaxID=10212 RepID=A0A7J7KE07_BUGNE|nr:hypothetical protein EB796_004802 [Bugula neritina]
MEVYRREEGYVAGNEREKLDMYLTYAPCGTGGGSPKNCATRLITFAENNNFKLNIKAARLPIGNERELGKLMAYPYCTVEAFREKDYNDLRKYLCFSSPLLDFNRSTALKNRDRQTQEDLREIRRDPIIPVPYPQNPSTYLLVNQTGLENQYMVFKRDELHAEQNFMEAYRNQDRYRTENGRIQLDIYLTLAPCGAQEINCAKQLRDFAEDYNFELNIKVAAPYQNNEKELSDLMASEYCTVEAFTYDDYRKLAGYLGIQDWVPTQATLDRDEQTRQALQRIQEGDNNVNELVDHIENIQL